MTSPCSVVHDPPTLPFVYLKAAVSSYKSFGHRSTRVLLPPFSFLPSFLPSFLISLLDTSPLQSYILPLNTTLFAFNHTPLSYHTSSSSFCLAINPNLRPIHSPPSSWISSSQHRRPSPRPTTVLFGILKNRTRTTTTKRKRTGTRIRIRIKIKIRMMTAAILAGTIPTTPDATEKTHRLSIHKRSAA